MTILAPHDIARLTADERLTLIAVLWDSMADDDSLPHAQARELGRRLESFETDKADAVSWNALQAELSSRAA